MAEVRKSDGEETSAICAKRPVHPPVANPPARSIIAWCDGDGDERALHAYSWHSAEALIDVRRYFHVEDDRTPVARKVWNEIGSTWLEHAERRQIKYFAT